MSISIRLSRRGKKHHPFYKIVVSNTRDRRDGLPIEILGYYDPLKKTQKISLNKERLKYWFQKGALISEGLNKLFKQQSFSSDQNSLFQNQESSNLSNINLPKEAKTET